MGGMIIANRTDRAATPPRPRPARSHPPPRARLSSEPTFSHLEESASCLTLSLSHCFRTICCCLRARVSYLQSVQCFGRKKTAVAVCHCKSGKGLVKLNGKPLELVEPEILKYKAFEPLMLLGKERYSSLDLRVRVKSGGHVSQMYAVRQAIAKAIVAYYQKYVDEATKKEIKDTLLEYDRTLLVADPRRCEPKKFGGRGARARFQKSYR